MAASSERLRPGALFVAGPASTALRFALYALLGGLFTEGLVRGASEGWFEAVGAEGGPIEYAHYALCGSSALLFASASRKSSFRDVFSLVAFGAALGVIREADSFLDDALFQGAYKIPAAFVGAIALVRAYHSRATIGGQIARWVTTPAFALTASGVFVVLVYAQIVGQKELWQTLMGGSYLRPVKDVVEEIMELLGYFLIFFGAIESLVLALVSAPTQLVDTSREVM